MKGLLLNENLPSSLAMVLRRAGIDAQHVSECGLSGRSDLEVWSRAQLDGLAVITKDSDYVDLALARQEGKVVLVSTGNLRLQALKVHVSSWSFVTITAATATTAKPPSTQNHLRRFIALCPRAMVAEGRVTPLWSAATWRRFEPASLRA